MNYSLTTSEMVLLLLIAEQPGINGYTIRRLADERGFAQWAGVSASSIYNGLRRVAGDGLVESSVDENKNTKGPKGTIHRLTPSGGRAIRAAVRDGLSTTREHDPRFNIALSGIDLLGASDAAACLWRRADFLADEHDRVAHARAAAGAVRPAVLVFDRILNAIEAEQRWVAGAADSLDENVAAAP